ncbi:hypothetical protein JHK82_047833 [Glycine max]|nr:hypothetical protein JHK82_047833 [Glycine max]
MEERGKHKETHSEGETSTSKTREKRGEESVVELKDEDWEKRWSDELVATIKLIWIKGYDIPLKAWGEQCFSQIVSSFGTLVEIDESTKKFSKLDHA